jgi:predicted ester cyclase
MSIEDNKALVRRFVEELFNQKHLAIIDELIDANYLDHTPDVALPPGPEGYRQFASLNLTAFPDSHIIIEDQIAEGDKVVSRYTSQGTHTGDFMGIAPTGKSITITGIEINRIAAGKIVEGWSNFDLLGLLQQLGVLPPLQPAS